MKRGKYFRCLLTKDEDSLLKILAHIEGLSPSDFMSMLVKQNARERGLLSRPVKLIMIDGGRLGK